MTKTLLYLFFLLSLPLVAVGQQEFTSSANANCIFVHTPENPNNALKQLVSMLQDQGYFIKDYNSELKSITAYKLKTTDINTKFWVQMYVREFQELGTKIQFLAYYADEANKSSTYFEAKNTKGLLNMNEREAFSYLDKLAKQYPKGSVFYSVIE